MTEHLDRFARIKSLLQNTQRIDSHTISLVVAECDMVLTQRPAALQPGASNDATTQAQGNPSSDAQVDQGRLRDADSRMVSAVPEVTQRPAAQDTPESMGEVFWRVALVRSSHTPDLLVPWLCTSERDVARTEAHSSFIRWLTPSPGEPVGEVVARLSTDSIGERYLCFSRPKDDDPARPLIFGDTRPAPGVQSAAQAKEWKA